MQKINVGVIGLGIGEQHLIGYIQSKYVDKIYVFDFDNEKQDHINNKYKNESIIFCKDQYEILKNNEVNAVSIASYDQFHFDQIMIAIKNNKHIFCEKPICIKKEQLHKIKKELKKSKVVMTTNTILRVSPRFQEIKQKIQDNFFGKIYYMEFDYNYGRLQKIINGWRGKIDNFSVILSGGIHMVDLLLWYMNDTPKQIHTVANRICTEKSKLNLNDFSVSIMKFPNNSVAKVSSNFGCVYPHFHRIMIYGQKRTYEQSFESNFFLEKKEDLLSKINIKSDYPGVKKYDLIENFLKSIIYKESLIVSKYEMIKTMETCFRMIEEF